MSNPTGKNQYSKGGGKGGKKKTGMSKGKLAAQLKTIQSERGVHKMTYSQKKAKGLGRKSRNASN